MIPKKTVVEEKAAKRPSAEQAATTNPTAKKSSARKTAAKKSSAKKTAPTRSTAKKTTKKSSPKKSSPKKTQSSAKKTSAKKTSAKKTSAKKTAKKLPAKKLDGAATIAVDGSELDRILDLIGAGPPRDSRDLEDLERQLGAAVPGELRRWFARALDFDHPDADHPDLSDPSFAGALPDVPAWLAQLARPLDGVHQAIHQFVGAWPLGVKLERGDFLWVFAGLERYGELDTGGVFYFDGREMGGYFPGSITGFFRHELEELWKAYDGDDDEPDLRDTFGLAPVDPRRRPPAAAPLPAPLAEAWSARATAVNTRFEQIAALLLTLRGRDVHLPSLPSEAQWLAERPAVATSHPAAMFWLFAHWLLDNREELADAVALSENNPSRLVAALRAHVTSHDATAAYGKQQAALFDAVRKAAAR
ncbi:MAG: hypothetical protein JNL82_18060 [Myxococcales bacterium]|nr:hypothetical protein [Myxococcales bacterium]